MESSLNDQMCAILIVDDQPLYLKSLELALRKRYDVKTAQSLDASIDILTQGIINIALIDVRLDEEDEQNIDGLQLLDWIRKNRPQISVFMMSAYREFSYAEQAVNLGAMHFFRKPIDIENLITVLELKK